MMRLVLACGLLTNIAAAWARTMRIGAILAPAAFDGERATRTVRRAAVIALAILTFGASTCQAARWNRLAVGARGYVYGAPLFKKDGETPIDRRCTVTIDGGAYVRISAIDARAHAGEAGGPGAQVYLKVTMPGASGWLPSALVFPAVPPGTDIFLERPTDDSKIEIWHDITNPNEPCFAQLAPGTKATVIEQKGELYRVRVRSGRWSGATGWISCHDTSCVTPDDRRITDWEY